MNAEEDIVLDGTLVESGLLANQRQVTAVGVEIEVGNIVAVDVDTTREGVIEALEGEQWLYSFRNHWVPPGQCTVQA